MVDAYGNTVELPADVDQVAAVGQLALMVLILGGADRLAATDGELARGGYDAAILAGADQVEALWAAPSSALTEAGLQRLLELAPDVVVEASGSATLTDGQAAQLEAAGIAYLVLPATTSLGNVKTDMTALGTVRSNLVLADETNRASAKTQAALLEAMEEKQVTVDSVTYRLEEPFMVMATQNPLESFGTYPLPEAQIDRFLIKLSMGYPSIEEEQRIVHAGGAAKAKLSAVISRQEVLDLRALADRVWVEPDVERYMVEIVAATRRHPKLALGSSPRGSLALNSGAKVLALFRGRSYVVPDDVKYLAPFVLGHRITLSHEAKAGQTDPKAQIGEIVDGVLAPL